MKWLGYVVITMACVWIAIVAAMILRTAMFMATMVLLAIRHVVAPEESTNR